MVVIPGQRPLKFVRSNSTIIQKAINPANTAPLLKKPIMFRNINNNCNANILKKTNTTSTASAPASSIQNMQNNMKVPVATQKLGINPLGLIKSLTKQITVKKMPSNKKPKTSSLLQGSKLLTNLPPGITIKPVSQPSVSGTKKEQNIRKPTKTEVSSVELDDEESFQSTGSPQWYLRPEEQAYNMHPSYEDTDSLLSNNHFSMEEQNNMEPDALKFVEIVIEDSPVKHHSEIGKELAITIEDSPVKSITTNNKGNESDREKSPDKIPLSKKKLEYPKENDEEKQVVEIEIDMCASDFNSNNSKEEPSSQKVEEQNIEKSEKNSKDNASEKNTDDTSTKNETNEEQKKTDEEFHPEYQKFIDLCFKLENSPDMNKIVEKKIKSYYKQCPKEYVESEEFIEMVSSKVISIKASPEKMYLYIKDIVDELNLQRKMSKTVVAKKTVDKGI